MAMLFKSKFDKAAWTRRLPWPELRLGGKDVSPDCAFCRSAQDLLAFHRGSDAYFSLPGYYAEGAQGEGAPEGGDAVFLFKGELDLVVRSGDSYQVVCLGEDVTPRTGAARLYEDLWIYDGEGERYFRVDWEGLSDGAAAVPEIVSMGDPHLLVRADDGSFLYLHEGIALPDAIMTTLGKDVVASSASSGIDAAFQCAMDLGAREPLESAACAGPDELLYRNDGKYFTLWGRGRAVERASMDRGGFGMLFYLPDEEGYYTVEPEEGVSPGDFAVARLVSRGSRALWAPGEDGPTLYVDGDPVRGLATSRNGDDLVAVDGNRGFLYLFRGFYSGAGEDFRVADIVEMQR